jgi:iron complex transport system substrate-binding protein
MVGCSGSQSATTQSDRQKQPRIITDHMGRQVEVPEKPERVIALNPLMAQTLFALGVTPTAVPEEYKQFHPEANALPSIGIQQSPNIEILHQLKPDLIFAHIRNDGQRLDSLETTGAAVVYYDPGAGENPDPLLEIVRFFGHILNREKEAAAYAQKIDDLSAVLRQKVASHSIKSALVLKHSEGILVSQPGTFYGGLVARLGLENIVPTDLPGSKKEIFLQYDFEKITEKNPDIILLLVEGKAQQDQSNILAKYKNDPKWKELTAIKNNRMVIIPGKVGPGRLSTEEALQTVANLICKDQ